MGFSPIRLWTIRSPTSSRSARRSARYPSDPSFSLSSRTNRRTAHSALSSSSRIRLLAPSSSAGSSAIIRCASRMAPCSPSPRLWRICWSCSTDSFTAASRRAISASTSSGGMWNRGTRARRRSTGNTRPIATPGEAGIPVSFAKAPAGLSQAGKLHLEPAQVLVGLQVLAFSLLLGQLGRQLGRDALEGRAGGGDGRQPVERAGGGRANQELLFAGGLGERGNRLRGAGPAEFVSGAGADDRIGVLQLGKPAR